MWDAVGSVLVEKIGEERNDRRRRSVPLSRGIGVRVTEADYERVQRCWPAGDVGPWLREQLLDELERREDG